MYIVLRSKKKTPARRIITPLLPIINSSDLAKFQSFKNVYGEFRFGSDLQTFIDSHNKHVRKILIRLIAQYCLSFHIGSRSDRINTPISELILSSVHRKCIDEYSLALI